MCVLFLYSPTSHDTCLNTSPCAMKEIFTRHLSRSIVPQFPELTPKSAKTEGSRGLWLWKWSDLFDPPSPTSTPPPLYYRTEVLQIHELIDEEKMDGLNKGIDFTHYWTHRIGATMAGAHIVRTVNCIPLGCTSALCAELGCGHCSSIQLLLLFCVRCGIGPTL